jgi:amino acid permease
MIVTSIEVAIPTSTRPEDVPTVKNITAPHHEEGDLGTLGTVVMVFRAFVGIGILAMPYTMQKVGWLPTLILLPIFSVMILYSIDLLIRLAATLDFTGSK